VGALHVVRVDLELRLAIGVRVRRQQQVVIRLFGIGLLRARPDDDAPSEDAARMTVEHAIEVLVTLTMVGGMVDRRVMVRVLPAGEQIKAVENQCAARSREDRPDVVARQGGAECDGMEMNGAVAALMGLCRGDVIRASTLSLAR